MTSRTTPAPRRTALALVLTPLLLGGLVIGALSGLGLLSGARALPAVGGPSGTAADGEIPAGERVTVHDTDLPAIANLDAIDIGPFDATYWLSLHGAAYGLCQIYANETWHFELRPEVVTEGCPEPYLDPTYDPRLRA